MIPIIRWTLWQRRWSIMWWSIGIAAFIFITLIFFPTFKDQAALLQKSLENLPKATVQFLGGSTDFFSPIGYLNSQVFFILLPLLLSVLSINLGSSMISREESNSTLELLLSRPISRSRLLLAKGLAGTLILGIVSLVGLITSLLMAWAVNMGIPAVDIATATLACFLLSLSGGAVAFLVTTVGHAKSASNGIATFVALGGYLIVSLSGTVSWLKTPSKIFPFNYYHSETLLSGGQEWGNNLVFLIFIVGCGLIAWLSFRHRDIG